MPAPSLPTHEDVDRHKAWLSAYRTLAADRDRANWAIADWVAQGRRQGMADTSTALADELGVTHVKLRDQLRMGLAYPPDGRSAGLSYEAHSNLAVLPTDVRTPMMERAAAEGWSERRARKEATEYRQDNTGFRDEDQETSQAVQIMRAWNRASPQARRYFAELSEIAGFGIVDEEAACAAA